MRVREEAGWVRAIGQRLGFYLVTAVVAISLDFLIPRLIPGNPVDAILAKAQGQTFSKATISALQEQFGIDTKASLWSQYTHFWSDVVHFNFGVSVSNGFEPVSGVTAGAAPWTLGLVGVSTVISVLIVSGAVVAVGAILAALSDGPQTVPGQAEQTARFYGGVPGRGYARMVAEPQRIQCPLLCLNDPTDQEELRRQAAAAVEAAPDPASRHHVFAPLTKLKGRLAARTGDVLGPAAGAT